MVDGRPSAADLATARDVVIPVAAGAGAAFTLAAAIGASLEVKVTLAVVSVLSFLAAAILAVLEGRVRRHGPSAESSAADISGIGYGGIITDAASRPREGSVVFVCASTEDDQWRRRFVDMLRPLVGDRGVGVWGNERDMPAPSDYELEGAVVRSQAAFLLVSERFIASHRIIERELAFLRAHDVPLLAVLVEDCAWENVDALKGVQWWRDPPFAPVKDADVDREIQEIVYACMRLRDRLPLVDAPAVPADDGPASAMVAARTDLLTSSGRPGELHDVPPLPWGFVARKEFDPLRMALLGGDDGAVGITGRALGLHGQGGIGKTVLAAAIAGDRVIRENFPDGVFWVTVGQYGDLVASQRGLLVRLGVAHEELRSAAQGAALLAEALEERRCLVVVDDVWSTAAARAFRSVGPKGRVLYTTRDPMVIEGLAATVQRVDALPEDAARELLISVSETFLDAWPDEIGRILAATGRVALALALVGATVGRGGRAWRDVADELDYAGGTFLDHPYADIFKAMQVGVSALDDRLRVAYASLAVYPEDTRVPVAAVARLWSGVHARSERATRAQLRALADRALLSLEDDTFGFHDLQREFLMLQVRDVALLHDDLLRRYRALLPSPGSPWRHLPHNEMYIWSHLLYHLRGAGHRESLRTVACDLGFLALRCFHDGLWAVESDLCFAQTVHPDDDTIAWLLRVFFEGGHVLFDGHTTAEEVATTLAAKAVGAPEGADVGAVVELLPSVVLLVRRDCDVPDALARALIGRGRAVCAVAYASSGDQLASGGADGMVRLWNPASGEQIAVLEGHTRGVRHVTYAPSVEQIASASIDGTVRLWDSVTGSETAVLKGHTGEVREVEYSPSGDQLASGGADGTVRLWNPMTGEQIAIFESHTGRVWAVKYVMSGHLLASGDDETLRLWDPAGDAQTTTLSGHIGGVRTLDYAPSSGQLASGGASADGTVRLWNPATGEQTVTLQGQTRVTSVAYAPSGGQLAGGGNDGMVRLWDPLTGHQIATLKGHFGGVLGVAYAPSGAELASGGADGAVRLWDPVTGEETATLEGHAGWVRAAAYAPSGGRLASANPDGTVQVCDLASGKQIATLEGHAGWVRAAAYAPCGQLLATGGDDGLVRLWDVASGEQAAVLDGHAGSVNAIAYAPCGQLLATGGDDGLVRLWDVASGEQAAVLEGHAGSVNAIAYAPCGQLLASAGTDGTVRVWSSGQGRSAHHSLHTRRRRRTNAPLTGHTGEVLTVAFAPDGHLLASGGADGTVRLWASSGVAICCAKLGRSIAALIWDPDGITIGTDGDVLQVDVIDRARLASPGSSM